MNPHLPIEMLGDTITFHKYLKTTDKVIFADPITINNVRIQFDENYRVEDNVRVKSLDNFLIIDCLYSNISGKPIEDFSIFDTKSYIVYKDKRYTITKVEFIRLNSDELIQLEIEVK